MGFSKTTKHFLTVIDTIVITLSHEMHQKLWMSAKCHTNFKLGVNIATAW